MRSLFARGPFGRRRPASLARADVADRNAVHGGRLQLLPQVDRSRAGTPVQVSEELRQVLLADVLARCSEMAALDLVWRDLAGEFGGDLRSPELQAKADETWTGLRSQIVRFGGPKRLPPADENAVAVIREKVEQALAFLRVQAVTR